MSAPAIMALLGREDRPTDGVRDFVYLLGRAVEARGRSFSVERLPPSGQTARARLRQLVRAHPGAWFILQYTALQWSPRALPVVVPALLRTIRDEGGRPGIVFHDVGPYAGSRVVDHVRRAVQRRAMRAAALAADHAFIAGQHRSTSTVPEGFAGWAPALPRGLTFLPVGSVLPPLSAHDTGRRPPRAGRPGGRARIGVFGVSDGRDDVEVREIAAALRLAQQHRPLEFVAFGRGTDRARAQFDALIPHDIPARILGVISPEQLLEEARALDALLFVRHHVSAQRSSAMAAVGAGVPIVGYAGLHTAQPLTNWGVRLVPEGDVAALAAALTTVIGDEALWQELHASSLEAYASHLTWERIADRFLDDLR